MSNTRSSRPKPRSAGQHVFLREMVAERAGHEWCLFLDRDGVINRQIVGDYVRSWQDFEWLPQASTAIEELRRWAPHIVVVTNQQGIGKALMSADDVADIHRNVQSELASRGVLIDAFQVCPHLQSQECACRKPKPGLILDWLTGHPESEPSLSIMVGDSKSDLELANNVAGAIGGCVSILIGGRAELDALADASFDSLWDFAVAVRSALGEHDS